MPKIVRRAHQEREYLEHRDDPARALVWWCRTGKTEPTVSTMCYQFDKFALDGCIVVAPHRGDAIAWVEDKLPMYAWNEVNHKALFWESRKQKTVKQPRDFTELCAHSGLSFLVIIPEALLVKGCQKALVTFLKANPRCGLIVDESHRFGRPGARRTKKLRGLALKTCFRRILSGTPWHERPLQAYSQFDILERHALGASTFAEFEARYAEKVLKKTAGGASYPHIVGYKNLDDLAERVSRYASFVSRDEADLPELIVNSIYGEMIQFQSELYKEVKEKHRFEHWGEKYEVPPGLPYIMKLQQIASGLLYTPTEKVKLFPDYHRGNPRVELLKDELEDVPGKAVIWCVFTEEVFGLCQALGADAVPYYGEMLPHMQEQSLERFKKSNARWLVANPQLAGEALDLSVADTIIWYSHTVSATQRDQASERASIGSNAIGVLDIILSPVDKYIVELTRRKVSVADHLKGMADEDLEMQL